MSARNELSRRRLVAVGTRSYLYHMTPKSVGVVCARHAATGGGVSWREPARAEAVGDTCWHASLPAAAANLLCPCDVRTRRAGAGLKKTRLAMAPGLTLAADRFMCASCARVTNHPPPLPLVLPRDRCISGAGLRRVEDRWQMGLDRWHGSGSSCWGMGEDGHMVASRALCCHMERAGGRPALPPPGGWGTQCHAWPCCCC